jgi:hypothetical protein
MQNPAAPTVSIPSILLRLLIALILGLLVGLTIYINPSSPSLQWLMLVPIAVFLVAMLLSIVFDPRVRHGTITPICTAIAILRTLLVIGAPILIILVLGIFVSSFGPIVVVVAPLEVSLIAAFTVGSETLLLAIGCGLAAWLGVGILLLISAYINSKAPGNDFGSLILSLIVVGVVIGFGFAALGGFLGRLVRRWALGL